MSETAAAEPVSRRSEAQQAAMLSRAVTHVADASLLVSKARKDVVPSGDLCVLSYEDNYAYQTALDTARSALSEALNIVARQCSRVARCDHEWRSTMHDFRECHFCGERDLP